MKNKTSQWTDKRSPWIVREYGPKDCPKCKRPTLFLERLVVDNQPMEQMYCHNDSCRYTEKR